DTVVPSDTPAPATTTAIPSPTATSTPSPSQTVVPSTVPAFDHIFIVVEENHSYDDVIGNPALPYFNALANQNGLAGQYVAIRHPSLPNYLALTGGDTFGITINCKPNPTNPAFCPIHAPNITDRIESAGKSWKAYNESMPSPCFLDHFGNYAPRHNPFVYYDDIRTDETRCNSHVVPLSQLATDLMAPSTTPDFVWITPDVCSDMHDCSETVGDTWLRTNLPFIFDSAAWTSQNSVLFIVWDEGTDSLNRVATLVIGPAVKPAYQSLMPYDHYSLLRTVEVAWGLAPLTTNDANATPFIDFWK
ncbi:MAG TPA: alkaline phosphatase family protein, partial [Anaerolineae bacterium]|nr:alkaline phosphatase family protein [Anaerolineae bacterium]